MVCLIIEECGGCTFQAYDGAHGVEVYKENSEAIDLVFVDFSMPRMNGYQCYLELKALRPDLPVIMCSGLTVTPKVDALRRSGAIQFLSKPFPASELIMLINRLVPSALPLIRDFE